MANRPTKGLSVRRASRVCTVATIAVIGLACQVGENPISGPQIGIQRQAILDVNGIEANGIALNGIALNGVNLNGIALNGIALNGIALNGIALNGIALNGIALNGIALNGVNLNGIALNGIALNGVLWNGIALNGIALNGITFHGDPLTAQQREDFKDFLDILAECALASGESITIYDNATPIVYHGSEGHDPAWRDTVPTLTTFGTMGQCAIDRGAAAGHTVFHEPVVYENFKTILEYLIGCALPAGTDVQVTDIDNSQLTYSGSLGYAPTWETGPIDLPGRRRVSACLAARSNSLGKTNQVSLRIPGDAIGKLEEIRFAHHEGAFAGDLFDDTAPYVKSCAAAGGISGRTCASDAESCGFDSIGDCAIECTEAADSGTYTACGVETEIVSTFLALDDSVAFGDRHTCLRLLDGTVECWGHNNQGQLGIGSASAQTYSTGQPVTALGDRVDALASSYLHTCARTAKGEMKCWGDNYTGQLGDGTTVDQPSPVHVQNLGADVAQTAAADQSSCAVLTSGILQCWGANNFGQLGDGTTTNQLTPQVVPNLDSVVKAAITRHTCALQANGSLSCWGYNWYGQVGDGSRKNNKLSPVEIVAATDPQTAVDVCTGYEHTCAVLDDGTVKCWGRNNTGQIGDGSTSDRHDPTPVTGLTGARYVGCGYRHTCALLDDQTVWCWGHNAYGQLGKGSATSFETTPFQVAGITGVRQIAIGRDYGCAGLDNGSLWCWGRNDEYQLGDESTNNAPTAVRMSNFSCGDGTCDSNAQETDLNCAADCATAQCGDSVCSGGEDCTSCPGDCGACPSCGDATCDPGEDCSSCPGDCGACPYCGDGTCDSGEGEDCNTCESDCGTCNSCAAQGEYCASDDDCCLGPCKKNSCKN